MKLQHCGSRGWLLLLFAASCCHSSYVEDPVLQGAPPTAAPWEQQLGTEHLVASCAGRCLGTLPRAVWDCLVLSERAFEIALFKMRVLSRHRIDFHSWLSPRQKRFAFWLLPQSLAKRCHRIAQWHAHASGLHRRGAAAQGSFSLWDSLKDHIEDWPQTFLRTSFLPFPSGRAPMGPLFRPPSYSYIKLKCICWYS